MLKFKTVHGSQETKPVEAEFVGNMAFVRKNIHRITQEDSVSKESVKLWEYEEAYGTHIEYTDYLVQQNERGMTDLEIAQIENERATTDLEIAVAELQYN